MNSNIGHKNTIDAVRFCKYKNYDYELINPCPYEEFLDWDRMKGSYSFQKHQKLYQELL